MPEGHTIHRLAAEHKRLLARHPVSASSPQGRFVDGAAMLDGHRLTKTDAHGKHLFHRYSCGLWLHVHLGLYGQFRSGRTPVPEPVGQVRLRLVTKSGWTELRGPTACELFTDAEKDAVHARLGPDPLRPDSDPAKAWERVRRSRVSIGELLMDQRIVAGVGNVYRAEVLFRHGLDPRRAGRELAEEDWTALWTDLCELMALGVRTGQIDTVRDEHMPEAMGRPPRVDDHCGEVYVYRRAGQPCHLCGTSVLTAVVAGRNLYWCPICQA